MSLPGARTLRSELCSVHLSWCERLQAVSTMARLYPCSYKHTPSTAVLSILPVLSINPTSPTGALPGGKAEKPELDPAGKQPGCFAKPGKVLGKGGRRLPRTHSPWATSPQSHSQERQWQPQAGTSQSAGVHGEGEWEMHPLSSARRAGWPGARGSPGISREQSGCWQPALLAVGGRVPGSCSSWGWEKAQKALGVCVLSPRQPRPRQQAPAKTCWWRAQGRRSSIPYVWGDIRGVSQPCDGVAQDPGQSWWQPVPWQDSGPALTVSLHHLFLGTEPKPHVHGITGLVKPPRDGTDP